MNCTVLARESISCAITTSIPYESTNHSPRRQRCQENQKAAQVQQHTIESMNLKVRWVAVKPCGAHLSGCEEMSRMAMLWPGGGCKWPDQADYAVWGAIGGDFCLVMQGSGLFLVFGLARTWLSKCCLEVSRASYIFNISYAYIIKLYIYIYMIYYIYTIHMYRLPRVWILDLETLPLHRGHFGNRISKRSCCKCNFHPAPPWENMTR